MSTSGGTSFLPVHKAVCLLVLASLAAYGNSLTKDFVLDDLAWISANEQIARPADYMRSPIGTGRPIIALSLLLNYYAGGLDVVGYHALNVTIHLLAALTLFGILRRTLLLPRWPANYLDRATDLAFAVALLWIVHPLQTQSVTYVIQRCESMMGLFFLLALYCAIRAWDSPRAWLWQLGSILSGAAGACCKEIIVGAPLLVVLYDWIFVERSPRRLLRRRGVLYLGLAISSWGVVAWLRALSSMSTDTAGFSYSGITPLSYFLTQPGVILHYLRLSIWPVGQCLDYLGWPIASKSSDWLLPGLVVALLFAGTVWAICQRSWLGFVGAWFFIILGPTSSFMPIADVAFEHRMYLPLASIAVLVVVGVDAVIRRLAGRGGVALLSLAAGSLITLTIRRNEDYRTALAIYTDSVEKSPFAYRSRLNRAGRLPYEERDQAHAECDRVLEQNSTYFLGNAQRGRLELTAGQYQQAAEDLYIGLRSGQYRALTFTLLGQCHYELGKTEKALAAFREAVREAPGQGKFRLTLALLLNDLGHVANAASERKSALDLKPDLPHDLNAQARSFALARSTNNLTQQRLALFLARQAAFADPENPDYLDTLAIAYAAAGNFKGAVATAKTARKKAESRGDAALAGEIEQRIELFERGLPYRVENLRKLQNGTLNAEKTKE
jgi:tetratricopeptide (TPR) repeat protein